MKIKLLLTLWLASLLTTSCKKSDFDVFEEKAAGFAQSDKQINSEELDRLKSEATLYSEDRDFKRFFTANAFDEEKLMKFLRDKGYTIQLPNLTDHKQDQVNVYLENSGSMFGYVEGDTEYKDALTELLVQLGGIYGKKNIHLNFINTKIYPIDFKGNVAQYPGTLTPGKLKVVGDITHSDINEIYRQIIEKTPEQTVSILLSDCIYSVSGTDTTGKLEMQKSLTKDVFQDSGMSTLIVKLNSVFNGFYYPKNNIKQKIVKQYRPYYMSILGSSGALAYLYNNIKFQPDFKGYENKVFLSDAYNDQSIYHTIVNTKNTTDFRPIREFSDNGSIRGMEAISVDDRNGKTFTFSIAVDLAGIPVEEDVATNPQSYSITKGDYKITAITQYDPKPLKPASVSLVSKSGKQPTHIITFVAKTPAYTDLEFSLKNEIPQWVYASSTNDDTDVKTLGAKTFGFKYLAEGISEAQQTKTSAKHYFKINIKINR